MNATNYKIVIEVLMKEEIEKWKRGEMKSTVSTQFDEYTLESAIEAIAVIDEETTEKLLWFKDQTVMQNANFLSNFQPEEMSAGWVN